MGQPRSYLRRRLSSRDRVYRCVERGANPPSCRPPVPVSAGRVILIVLGSIGVLFGLAVLAGGGFLLWADRTQRDDGYLTTPTERFATPTYALTRTRLEVATDGVGWGLTECWLGMGRNRGERSG